jgi:hypothetical protein
VKIELHRKHATVQIFGIVFLRIFHTCLLANSNDTINSLCCLPVKCVISLAGEDGLQYRVSSAPSDRDGQTGIAPE